MVEKDKLGMGVEEVEEWEMEVNNIEEEVE